jgi:protein gp37
MPGESWWWDIPWSPVGGCSYESPGCGNCFAPAWIASHTHPSGDVHHGVIKRVKGRPVFNDKLTVLRNGHHLWTFPLDYSGAKHPKHGPGKPSLIFVVGLGDLFHEKRHVAHINRVCATLAMSNHIGLLLTKRTRRMAEHFAALDPLKVDRWQPKLWLGFSAENQEWFDRRWADMRALADAGWFVFVSIAPMIGPVKLPPDFLALGQRTWVIVSGEQRVPGTRPRPMKRQWARDVHAQCRKAGIAFFLKQMAKGAPIPPDLKVRQFPSM